ncbi:UPF0312 protein [Cellvibrio zantedeschiae]|uniref:UPF0312 protein n=1 Tax=Cellvibrio zantedeschiae TaxID=1237077 RepID=A0ABQ3BA69_9GAMM|nr:YceI family protein [Cellvibrio zantedeschiae]GGY86156.1 UPF0312 protein [Cellvibrio zantedeschiae]
MFAKKQLAILAISSLSAIGLPAFADNYTIDTKGAHASINFSVKHMGFSVLTGRFDTFTGDFTYDPANLAASTINVTIDTTSVDTNHAERDKHLRSPDFLNAEKNPKATFVSKKVVVGSDKTSFNLIGDFTLNGVTKSITIAAKKVGEGKDPWGGYRAGFEGTTEIFLKDFAINTKFVPDTETIKLSLNVEGLKK